MPDIVQHKNRTYALKKGLTATQLKLIAVIAMLIDHIAFAFVDTASFGGQAMHFLGRITAPVMCFFISEGYHHTRDRRKYALRLLICAVISHYAFAFFRTGKFFHTGTKSSVITTLMLSLAAVAVYNGGFTARDGSTGVPAISFRLPLIAMLCFAAQGADWGMFGILFTMSFEIARPYGVKKQAQAYLLAALCYLIQSWSLLTAQWSVSGKLYVLGLFLPVPLLMLYNGKRSNLSSGPVQSAEKWFFYIFYPAHLLLLGLLAQHT